MRRHEEAVYPFQFLHIDLAQHEGKQFLISTDQFSGFPHLIECGKTATAKQVVEHVLAIISNYAIPVTIYSDGGPQFLEDGVFDKFCAEWGIEHIISSPHNPQSNGVAEEAVKEMKKLIRGTFDSRTGKLDLPSICAGMLLFRNTPRAPHNLSPSELLFGQRQRDNLPMSRDLFKPEARFEIEKRRQEVMARQRAAQNLPGRELSLLHPGQKVFVQNPMTKQWKDTGTVQNFGINNREYLITLDRNGKTFRRNRKFLRPMNVEVKNPPKQPVQAPVIPSARAGSQAEQRRVRFETDFEGEERGSESVAEPMRPADQPSVRPKRNSKIPNRFNRDFVYSREFAPKQSKN